MKTVRAGATDSRARGWSASLIIITVLAALALGASVPASAQHPLSPTDFTLKKLKVEASTTQAGAQPDLTIGMTKPRNSCGTVDSNILHCTPTEPLKLQQNLKKMVTSLPDGLMGDVNAAPYCNLRKVPSKTIPPFTDPPGWGPAETWYCENQDSIVGSVDVISGVCIVDVDHNQPSTCLEASSGWRPNANCRLTTIPFGAFMCFTGLVFNEKPQRGEQARLVVLLPAYRRFITYTGWIKTEISIKVRPGAKGIDTTIDDMPDAAELQHGVIFPAQMFEFRMTLKGDTGSEKGHPFLNNPTSCEPKRIDAEFTGYENNYPYLPATQGTGEGKTTVAGSVPFQATGCDALAYTPSFGASTSSQAPGSSPSLTTTIAQSDGQANTKHVDVSFPEGMGVNLNTSLKPCGADALAAGSCPESSLMGTATATSRVLPTDGGPLTGNVYLTGLKGSSFGLSIFLNTASGFLNEPLRIDGTAGIKDGRIIASFNDLPDVRMNSFTLNFRAGAQSLMKLPNKCGNYEITANFTAQSGKTATGTAPLSVAGCSGPVFDADLSELTKGKRTALTLEVTSQKRIEAVTFGIDRFMKLSAKGLKTRKLGEISLSTDSGARTAALKRGIGAQKRKKSLSLRAGTLGNLGVNLFRKRFKRVGTKKFKARSNIKNKTLKKKTVLKNRAAVKSLPKGTTRVTVTLNQDETKLLRNSKKCRANFLALVKTDDGTKYALKVRLKLRGKDCSKKKKRKSAKGGK